MLEAELKGAQFKVSKHDYFREPSARQKLFDLNARWGIPERLQSHLVAVVGDEIVLEGHIPKAVVRDLLQWPGELPVKRLLLYQDLMGEPRTYAAWAFRGSVREYDRTTPIRKVLDSLVLENPKSQPSSQTPYLLPSVVITAGLLDGINPCAFAVMLFLVAFLFAIRRLRTDVLIVGAVFIGALYLAYFMIGVGLLGAMTVANQPHLAGRLGGYIVVTFGMVSLLGALFPGFAIQRGMPASSWALIRGLIQRATLPSAAGAGFLVGLCTLPCSGGIYVATLGLLATQATYLKGLAYIALYNLANVVPLVIILGALGGRAACLRLAQWERASSREAKAIFGTIEILLGLGVLAWIG